MDSWELKPTDRVDFDEAAGMKLIRFQALGQAQVTWPVEWIFDSGTDVDQRGDASVWREMR